MEILRHLDKRGKYLFRELDEGGYAITFFDSYLDDTVVWMVEKEHIVRLITDLGLVIGKTVKLDAI